MGGAPVNFAYMCSQLGAWGIPVSCIGEDEAGHDILTAVSTLGLESAYIQEQKSVPTGTVQVVLDAFHKPTYSIKEGVAWDYIELSEKLQRLASNVDAVCFGSLAQRAEISRHTIQSFLGLCPENALKIYDVNLRQSFYTASIIDSSLRVANVLKISDEELLVVAALLGLKGSIHEQIRQLILTYNLRMVAYTRGADGSMLVTATETVDHAGCKPKAIDTVGAGDSYTATMCMGLLSKRPLDEIILHASRVAAYVCEQVGATPVLPDDVRFNLEVA